MPRQFKQIPDHEKGMIHAWHAEGIPNREIARRLDISEGAIRYNLKKLDTRNSMDNLPKSGRPRGTTERADRHLIQTYSQNQSLTAPELRIDLAQATGIEVHRSTISRRLAAAGLRRGKVVKHKPRPKQKKGFARGVGTGEVLAMERQTVESIRYKDHKLLILNQLLLPHKMKYEAVTGVEDGWQVIKQMKVRGAPCIAIVGCLSLAVELTNHNARDTQELVSFIRQQLDYLITARPTAVNMSREADKMKVLITQLLAQQPETTAQQLSERIIQEAESMLVSDVQCNKNIGQHGAQHIKQNCRPGKHCIMTHCNTGSLATAGYGTALGVIHALFDMGELDHVLCTETRPYNQGARLTAFELVYEKIPASLITDSMAAFAMVKKNVTAVVVGADRVVANGDTANKIGTYQLALCAKYHDIPFYVACPSTTCDFNLANGDSIIIEERPAKELTCINDTQIAAQGIGVWNPAFDVTPAVLITGGIITEYGVFKPNELQEQLTKHMTS